VSYGKDISVKTDKEEPIRTYLGVSQYADLAEEEL
jgi:hypothetical protein